MCALDNNTNLVSGTGSKFSWEYVKYSRKVKLWLHSPLESIEVPPNSQKKNSSEPFCVDIAEFYGEPAFFDDCSTSAQSLLAMCTVAGRVMVLKLDGKVFFDMLSIQDEAVVTSFRTIVFENDKENVTRVIVTFFDGRIAVREHVSSGDISRMEATTIVDLTREEIYSKEALKSVIPIVTPIRKKIGAWITGKVSLSSIRGLKNVGYATPVNKEYLVCIADDNVLVAIYRKQDSFLVNHLCAIRNLVPRRFERLTTIATHCENERLFIAVHGRNPRVDEYFLFEFSLSENGFEHLSLWSFKTGELFRGECEGSCCSFFSYSSFIFCAENVVVLMGPQILVKFDRHSKSTSLIVAEHFTDGKVIGGFASQNGDITLIFAHIGPILFSQNSLKPNDAGEPPSLVNHYNIEELVLRERVVDIINSTNLNSEKGIRKRGRYENANEGIVMLSEEISTDRSVTSLNSDIFTHEVKNSMSFDSVTERLYSRIQLHKKLIKTVRENSNSYFGRHMSLSTDNLHIYSDKDYKTLTPATLCHLINRQGQLAVLYRLRQLQAGYRSWTWSNLEGGNTELAVRLAGLMQRVGVLLMSTVKEISKELREKGALKEGEDVDESLFYAYPNNASVFVWNIYIKMRKALECARHQKEKDSLVDVVVYYYILHDLQELISVEEVSHYTGQGKILSIEMYHLFWSTTGTGCSAYINSYLQEQSDSVIFTPFSYNDETLLYPPNLLERIPSSYDATKALPVFIGDALTGALVTLSDALEYALELKKTNVVLSTESVFISCKKSFRSPLAGLVAHMMFLLEHGLEFVLSHNELTMRIQCDTEIRFHNQSLRRIVEYGRFGVALLGRTTLRVIGLQAGLKQDASAMWYDMYAALDRASHRGDTVEHRNSLYYLKLSSQSEDAGFSSLQLTDTGGCVLARASLRDLKDPRGSADANNTEISEGGDCYIRNPCGVLLIIAEELAIHFGILALLYQFSLGRTDMYKQLQNAIISSGDPLSFDIDNQCLREVGDAVARRHGIRRETKSKSMSCYEVLKCAASCEQFSGGEALSIALNHIYGRYRKYVFECPRFYIVSIFLLASSCPPFSPDPYKVTSPRIFELYLSPFISSFQYSWSDPDLRGRSEKTRREVHEKIICRDLMLRSVYPNLYWLDTSKDIDCYLNSVSRTEEGAYNVRSLLSAAQQRKTAFDASCDIKLAALTTCAVLSASCSNSDGYSLFNEDSNNALSSLIFDTILLESTLEGMQKVVTSDCNLVKNKSSTISAPETIQNLLEIAKHTADKYKEEEEQYVRNREERGNFFEKVSSNPTFLKCCELIALAGKIVIKMPNVDDNSSLEYLEHLYSERPMLFGKDDQDNKRLFSRKELYATLIEMSRYVDSQFYSNLIEGSDSLHTVLHSVFGKKDGEVFFYKFTTEGIVLTQFEIINDLNSADSSIIGENPSVNKA